MDVQRAKTSSSMRSAGTSSSNARGTPQSHGLSGRRDDFGARTAKPTTTPAYGGPSSTSSSIQEDDLEAFFKDSRKVTTTTVKDEGRPGGGGKTTTTTKATDDVFGDLGAFASGAGGVTMGGSGNASRAPRRETTASKTTSGSDLDDLFTGSRRGDDATGGETKTTGSGEHARGASGGSDFFDLLSPTSRSASEFGALRPQSPGTEKGASLMAHDADGDGLIDGLDEILGGVSIASSPRRTSAPDDGGKVVSSSSLSAMSHSASLTNASDLLDDLVSSSPEAPVGLARFRSTTSVDSAKSQEAPKPPSVKVECKPKEAPARPQPSTSNSVDDLDDFFSAGAS